ncbi:MAG: hypothetical protein AB4426_28990 [Xenococcaceae cyanobacterium]
MNKVDYVAMSDQELKRYFLEHRDDVEAFHAYMDRLNARPRNPIVKAGELDHLSSDEQVQIVAQRIQERFGDDL